MEFLASEAEYVGDIIFAYTDGNNNCNVSMAMFSLDFIKIMRL